MVVAVAVLAEVVLAVVLLLEVVLVVMLLAEVVLVVVVLAEVVLFDVDDDSVHVVVVPCLSCCYFYDVPCLALLLCS